MYTLYNVKIRINIYSYQNFMVETLKILSSNFKKNMQCKSFIIILLNNKLQNFFLKFKYTFASLPVLASKITIPSSPSRPAIRAMFSTIECDHSVPGSFHVP